MTKQRKDYLRKDKDTRVKRLWMADVYKFMKQGTSIRWQKRRQKAYAMEMASKWECFHFDANARVRRFKSEKRYNDRYERLLILWWRYARCAETKKSREIKILSRLTTIPCYTIQIIVNARQKIWEDALRYKYKQKITV